MRATALLLSFLLLASGPAVAHEKHYVNVTGDHFLVPNDCDGDLGMSQGGVCFPGGHIVPNEDGKASISLFDKFLQPASGCVQQAGQPCRPFCGNAVLEAGINWEPTLDVQVFVDGVVFGNPFASPCGFAPSWGVFGRVHHAG